MPAVEEFKDFDNVTWCEVEELKNEFPKDNVVHINRKYSGGSQFGKFNVFCGCLLVGGADIEDFSTFIKKNQIGPHSIIGRETEIGAHSIIGSDCTIEPRCIIGEESRIKQQTRIMYNSRIGYGTSFESPTIWDTELSFGEEIYFYAGGLSRYGARAKWSGDGYEITPVDPTGHLKVRARKLDSGSFEIRAVA